MAQKKLAKKEEEEEEGVDAEDFRKFVTMASESDLEEVLTFYTHKNKSASVFLGTNSGGTKLSNSQLEIKTKGDDTEIREKAEKGESQNPVDKNDVPQELQRDQQKETKLSRSPSATEDEENAVQLSLFNASSSIPDMIPPQSITSQVSSHTTSSDSAQVSDHRSVLCLPPGSKLTPTNFFQSTAHDCSSNTVKNTPHLSSDCASLHRCRSGSYTVGPFSSFQSAMQIYSQRLIRPSSAKAAGSRSHSPSRPRGTSARANKDGEDCRRYSHGVVAAELQRLAEKQAARQYSPPSHISLLTQQLTNLNLMNGAVGRANAASPSYRPPLYPGGSFWAFQTHTHRADIRPASLAVKTLETDTFAWEGDAENSLHNKLTGSQLMHPKAPPSAGSYQLHFALQQLQHQKLQSRQLLDQSRARHQALFANLPASSNTSIALSSGSGACKTSSAISSCQKAPSVHKIMPSQSASAHLVPKPPASHRQALIRKVASQRISKVTSAEVHLNGFQKSLSSVASCEPLADATGLLEVGPQIIFARTKPLSSRTGAIDTVVGQRKKRPVEGGPA